jgi:hypothetical protein
VQAELIIPIILRGNNEKEELNLPFPLSILNIIQHSLFGSQPISAFFVGIYFSFPCQ